MRSPDRSKGAGQRGRRSSRNPVFVDEPRRLQQSMGPLVKLNTGVSGSSLNYMGASGQLSENSAMGDMRTHAPSFLSSFNSTKSRIFSSFPAAKMEGLFSRSYRKNYEVRNASAGPVDVAVKRRNEPPTVPHEETIDTLAPSSVLNKKVYFRHVDEAAGVNRGERQNQQRRYYFCCIPSRYSRNTGG